MSEMEDLRAENARLKGAIDRHDAQVLLEQNGIMAGSAMVEVAKESIGKRMEYEGALRLLLDHIDYTAGACGVAEPIGGILPKEIIDKCRALLPNKRAPQ